MVNVRTISSYTYRNILGFINKVQALKYISDNKLRSKINENIDDYINRLKNYINGIEEPKIVKIVVENKITKNDLFWQIRQKNIKINYVGYTKQQLQDKLNNLNKKTKTNVLFINDIYRNIASYINGYNDTKRLRHTCKEFYHQKYDITMDNRKAIDSDYIFAVCEWEEEEPYGLFKRNFVDNKEYFHHHYNIISIYSNILNYSNLMYKSKYNRESLDILNNVDTLIYNNEYELSYINDTKLKRKYFNQIFSRVKNIIVDELEFPELIFEIVGAEYNGNISCKDSYMNRLIKTARFINKNKIHICDDLNISTENMHICYSKFKTTYLCLFKKAKGTYNTSMYTINLYTGRCTSNSPIQQNIGILQDYIRDLNYSYLE